MSSSSLLCQFLLISMIVIGTMIVPNVQALECYESVTKNASLAMGGLAAWEMNPKFLIENGGNEENSLAGTRQCPTWSNMCFTLHCTQQYGAHTVKGCAPFRTVSLKPEEICQDYRAMCARDDPKFYCRFCKGDKCNDE